MQIRYIGHACLAVEVGGRRILCDPWWTGPAYTGQWYPYPVPRLEPEESRRVDFLYISSGREDHLHLPTLKTITRDAALVIPKLRDPGLRDFLRTLGFRRVIEIGHGERRQLGPGVHATIYINQEDSILVLEAAGRTLVDANDALLTSPRHVVDHFARLIRARHPRIDSLFLGYSSASWFPSCIRITDDVGYDSRARDRAVIENFAYIVRALGPRMALPIGGGFALLDDRLRWINHSSRGAGAPCEEVRRQGATDIRTHVLAPGDRILGEQVFPAAHRALGPEESAAELQRLFALEISELRQTHEPDEPRLARLLEALKANAARRAATVLDPDQSLLCRIDLRDVPEISFLVDYTPARAKVGRCNRLRLAPMVLTTRLAVLEALATQDYGFESIRIGCGAVLQLRKRDLPARDALLMLLGRQPLPPTSTERLVSMLRSPWRSLDLWRRDLHWRRLELRIRNGEVRRFNDMSSSDPERWSPLRSEPLPPEPFDAEGRVAMP
jgi:hypothetical protein